MTTTNSLLYKDALNSMKAFKPLSFVIEISEHPKYVPGSGPPMTPISLRPPDGKDWQIHSVENLEGIPQYIVNPPNDPSGRIPVRKELILNWVSPRTYEDFEYLQAKKKYVDGWEQEDSILAKLKERKLRILQPKNGERFKTKQQADNTVRVQPAKNWDSDSDSEEVPARFPRNEVKNSPKKRRRSSDIHKATNTPSRLSLEGSSPKKEMAISRLDLDKSPDSKRQKLSDPSQNEPSLSSIVVKQDRETSEEESESDGNSEIGEDGSGQQHHGKEISARTKADVGRSPSPDPIYHSREHSMSTSFEAPPDAQSRDSSSSENTRNTKILPPASPPSHSVQESSMKAVTNLGFKECPPILPPKKRARSRPASLPARVNDSRASTPRTPSSSRSGGRLVTLMSASSDKLNAESVPSNGLRASPRNGDGDDRVRRISSVDNIMKDFGSSRIMLTGSRAIHLKHDQIGDSLTNPDGLGSSESVSPARDTRGVDIGRDELTIVLKPKNHTSMDEISGLIDDELRLVNGVTVRYYLVDWKGNSDPTWEAEYNVTGAAIEDYKNKLLQGSQGFDGALDDMEVIPSSPQMLRAGSESHFDVMETDDTSVIDLTPTFATNGYYKELDDSDVQEAIFPENGYEMEPSTLM